MFESHTFAVGRLRAALLLVRQSAESLASADGDLPRRRLAAFGGAETLRAGDGDLKLLLDLVLAAGGAGGVVVAVAVHCRGGARRGDDTGMTRGKKNAGGKLGGREWEEEECEEGVGGGSLEKEQRRPSGESREGKT